jgi:PAS domain S-box-containing protein
MKNKSQKEPGISQLRKIAEEIYAQNQVTNKEHSIEIDTLKLLHELEVHKIELVMQNTELQLAKEKSDQSAKMYAQLFNFMPSGYFITNSDSIILELNLNGAALLGQERSILIKERFTHFIATESLLAFDKFLNEIFISKKKQISEVTLKIRENSEIFVRLEGTVSENEEQCLVVVIDITDRKLAEESLQNAKDYAENLIQTANAIVVGMDTRGNIITFNNAAEKITGYTIAELRGRNWFEVIVPKNRFPEVWQIFEKLTTGGLPKYFENPILTKTGEERYIIWHNNEVKEHGIIIGTISFGMDITERRQVEEALRISEIKYRRLHESIVDGFCQTTMEGRIIDCNPSFLNMLGYTFEEISKLTYFDLTPEKWQEFEAKIIDDQIVPQGYSNVYEKEYIRKDGTILPVELRTFLIKNDNDEKQGMWALVRDNTHRKLHEEIGKSRLHLIQFSLNHTIDEFLEEMLNEAEKLTDSQISFIHFVKEDQKYLVLQNWSRRTKEAFCTAEGKEDHYPLTEAGVWVDCVHARKPVIHNDYASLPHRKGMPEGHARLIRELVVPVFRGDKITAILGVGNKAKNYTPEDADTLSAIANLAWEIAERMKAEEALRESEEHFRTIFYTSPIGMVLVNKHFNFLQVNQSFCDFTGYSAEELSNLTFKDITHPDYLSGDIEAIKQLASGKLKVYQNEKIYIRKDHQQVWGNVYVTPIFDNKGNFMYFLAMIKDINDRKIADAEIQRINEELREANAAKDKFFSIIAHDLKSPFNSILGFSEMLKDDVLNLRIDEIKHYANLIHSSAYHTYLLLENLLEWSRMQRGQISFSPRSVILDQLISDEFQVMNNNAMQKKISLICDIPKKLIVVADENMLSNIIRNLVSNAIKFTPKEGLVKVSAGAHDGFVHISVSDNGVGIKPEAIEKLFKIETSFTTRGTENEKGTGLGLLLCKEFIEKHGGKIWIESGPDSYLGEGKGSKFTFTIPDVI